MPKVTLTKEQIDACFEGETHQGDVIIKLYKLLHPDWDKIKKFNGFPRAGDGVWEYIMKKFRDFDEVHHPNVIKGGVWINNGWSSYNSADLAGWEAEPCTDVTYKDEPDTYIMTWCREHRAKPFLVTDYKGNQTFYTRDELFAKGREYDQAAGAAIETLKAVKFQV